MPQSLLSASDLGHMLKLAYHCPAGDFLEFGVYQGGSALPLYRVAQSQKRSLHLFDTFTGMPFADDCDHHRAGDFADVSLEELMTLMPEAHFHPGIFPESIPEGWTPVLAFVHVDADQYRSIMDAARILFPLLVPGGVMLFDDPPKLAGARAALEDSLRSGVLCGETGRTAGGKPFVRKS